ncbi:MAG: hypothetical protein ABJ092_10630 [Gillisia sp.]
MRKIIHTLILLLTCNLIYSQQDLESLNKKDLIALVTQKDQEITKLNRQLSSLNTEVLKNKKDLEELNKQQEDLKNLLGETTNRWLKDVFVDKYITNKDYFLESNIPAVKGDLEELKRNFEQYDIIIKSVLASKPSKEHESVAHKALHFNENYLALLRIREEIIPLKYNEELVLKTLQEIDSLPILQGGKLQETKIEMIGLLKNYQERNCILKLELDNFSKVDQEVARSKYKGFEKDAHFKDYPYFITVLQDIQKNVNLYTPDKLPCKIAEAEPFTSELPVNPEEGDAVEKALNKKDNNKIIEENNPESKRIPIENK